GIAKRYLATTMLLLTAITVSFSLLMIVAVGFYAIPSDVRSLIGQNCRNSRGRWKFKYFFRELVAVGNFYGPFLLAGALLGAVFLFLAGLVDEYVIPLDMVHTAVDNADLNVEQWKANLLGGVDSVQQRHQRWLLVNGSTKEAAVRLQRTLWLSIPIVVSLGFITLIMGFSAMSSRFQLAMEELVAREADRDRRRIAEEYLRNTAQGVERRRRHTESHAGE
ncbi:MAG: hypothetical protein AB8B91_23055, partial [Rubripirellula sp.]